MIANIMCVFENKAPLGLTTGTLVTALQEYVTHYLAPEWGVAANLSIGESVPAGSWGLIFTDDADQAQELGYHDIQSTPDGYPLGHVFVRTSAAAGEAISIVASHELAEMLVDPGCNLAAYSPRNQWVALEICDPVQDDPFNVYGLPMSNFVRPAWFGIGETNAGYDYKHSLAEPWAIGPSGYVLVNNGSSWQQIFGSWATAQKHRSRDSRLRRKARRRLDSREEEVASSV